MELVAGSGCMVGSGMAGIDDKRRRKVAIGQQGWSDTCYKVGRREGMSRRQGNKGKRSGVAAGALELVVELVECEGSSGAVGVE